MDAKRKLRTRKGAKLMTGQQTLKQMFGSKSSSTSVTETETAVVDVDATAGDGHSSLGEGSGHEDVVEIPAPPSSEPPARKALKPKDGTRLTASQPARVFSIFEKKQPKVDSPSDPKPILIPDSPLNEIIEVISDDTSSPEAGSSTTEATAEVYALPGSSQDDPIVVESIPIKPSVPETKPTKPTWSIFQKRVQPQLSSGLKGKEKATEGLPVPFPDSTSQHVRGVQSTFPARTSLFHRQERRTVPSPHEGTAGSIGDIFRMDELSQSSSLFNPSISVFAGSDEAYVETIPRSDRRYPAVSRTLARSRGHPIRSLSPSHQQAWTEKWRPRRADEVLGNEEHALYLRDWLQALRLQIASNTTSGQKTTAGSKKSRKRKLAKNRKPEVIRQVKRRKGANGEMADFLASDDEDDPLLDNIFAEDEDDLEFCRRMQDTLGYSSATTPEASSQCSSALSELEDDPIDIISDSQPFSTTMPNFGSQIHNTILLAGPSGCGKTAAVYACAEELGWEVFEVHPGSGERSGPELNRLIGDVGKNHIVHSGPPRSPQRRYGHAFFSQRQKSSKKSVIHIDSDEEEEMPIPQLEDPLVDVDTLLGPPVSEPIVKQSLVLIEEVDILYQSDTGFWPAVINIIKECRRPVVLTCNDMTLVPWADLPLQTTLHFTPCPTSLAASYLQASCLCEGYAVDRETISRLYNGGDRQTRTRDICLQDLRFAINQLQYLSGCLPPPSSTIPSKTAADSTQQLETDTILLSRGVDGTAPKFPTAQAKQWRILSFYDSISFTEDQLSRDPSSLTTLATESSDLLDVELGYPVLPLEIQSHSSLVSSFYQHDYSLTEDVTVLARSIGRSSRGGADTLLGDSGSTDSVASQLVADQSAFAAEVVPILYHCLQSTPILRLDSTLYTDHLPWIRYMVAVDNALEELLSPPGTQQSRRQTRTSKRAAQERHIPLEPAELEVLSRTALRVDEQ